MDTLLSKLTNLAYELFGVILPGIFALVSIGLLWAALGPVIEIWSAARIPALSSDLLGRIDTLDGAARVAAASCLAASLYLLGHALNWISRGVPDQFGKTDSRLRRAFLLLRLRFPKPNASFDASLTRLFDAAAAKTIPRWGTAIVAGILPSSESTDKPTCQVFFGDHVPKQVHSPPDPCSRFSSSILGFASKFDWRCRHKSIRWFSRDAQLAASRCAARSLIGVCRRVLLELPLHMAAIWRSIVTESYFLLYGPKLPSVQEEKT
jgi:hypothetical protein